MPITPEEDQAADKEQLEEIEKKVQDTDPDNKDTQEPEKPESDKADEDQPYWAQKGFKSEKAFVESYENAQKKIGEQGTELGQLRDIVREKPEEKAPEEDPYTEYDPYDAENVKWHQEKWARDAIEKQEAEKAERQAAEKVERDRLKMIGDFIASHKDLNEEAVKDVARFARDRGISQLEDAFIIMNNEKTPSQEVSPPMNKQTLADLPETLDGEPSGGKGDRDADDLSNEEWSGLSSEERKKYLEEVS